MAYGCAMASGVRLLCNRAQCFRLIVLNGSLVCLLVTRPILSLHDQQSEIHKT